MCHKCKEDYQKTENQCRDECDIETGDGCDAEIQECRLTTSLDHAGNQISHSYCHCLIPEDQLEDKNICVYKVNCNNGMYSDDCNGNGRCVQLPGIIGKSCLCNIDWAGEYCENPRTCSNGHGEFQKRCLNGSKCTEISRDGIEFKCECGDEFYGNHCENVHPCHHLKVSTLTFYNVIILNEKILF